MNTFEFFNRGLGRHLQTEAMEITDDTPSHEAAHRVLSANHTSAKGTSSRLGSGWAVITPGEAVLQLKLNAPATDGLNYSDATRYEAFLKVLENWTGEPVMFLQFDKKPLPADNLFITADLRCVRVCGPKGVETFDWTQPPPEKGGSTCHRILSNRKAKKDKEELNNAA